MRDSIFRRPTTGSGHRSSTENSQPVCIEDGTTHVGRKRRAAVQCERIAVPLNNGRWICFDLQWHFSCKSDSMLPWWNSNSSEEFSALRRLPLVAQFGNCAAYKTLWCRSLAERERICQSPTCGRDNPYGGTSLVRSARHRPKRIEDQISLD